VALTPAFAGAGSAPSRTRRPAGPAWQWPRPSVSRWVRYSASGGRTSYNRIGCAPLSARDPSFAAKLADIVGLYVDPPAHAVVLSLDEKSQIQALDRTQPGLPIKPGRC
jgi:hypothetical protein